MSSYDILMIVVIIGSIAFGAWKGMAWQLASLGSLVLSYFMALQFSDKLAPSISMEAPWNRVAAMLILYACTAAAVWIAFRFVAKVIDGIKLREFDRQLGALFGGLKGVLLCLVITFFAVSLTETGKSMVQGSQSSFYMAQFLDKAHPLVPKDVHEVLHPYFHKLQDGLGVPGDEGDSHHSQEDGAANHGVPILDKLPFTGHRRAKIQKKIQDLMKMVTPRIINQEEEESLLQ